MLILYAPQSCRKVGATLACGRLVAWGVGVGTGNVALAKIAPFLACVGEPKRKDFSPDTTCAYPAVYTKVLCAMPHCCGTG